MFNLRNKFRYYFIRKKSPLSYILWSDILRREMSYDSLPSDHNIIIRISTGAPKDNYLRINVHDEDGDFIGAASAKISYRDALRISKAASKAHGIDRANKRAEKARHK